MSWVGFEEKASMLPFSGRYDGHVRGDSAIDRIECGDDGLCFPGRPQREVAERVRGQYRRVQHISLGGGRRGTRAVLDRRSQYAVEGPHTIACVEHPAWGGGVKGQSVRAGAAKYPFTSSTTSEGFDTKTDTSPLLPAGTMAPLAATDPVGEFSVDTSGWVCPLGHIVR